MFEPGSTPGPRPATAASNKRQADQEATRLLALAQVPPGATEIGTPPAALRDPLTGNPVTSSLIDHARYWQVPMSFTDALAWVKANPPRCLRASVSSEGSGPHG
ncbi:MAG: hypothetical protein ACRDL8_14265, partial [Solirubrobacteraceae bacterium]